MVTLVAIAAVAMLTNATTERNTSNSFSKRVRAEMAAQSGLAAALNALVGSTGPNDFRYITVAGDDDKPALIPLNTPAPDGSITPDLAHKRPLYSVTPAGAISSPTPASLTLSKTAPAKKVDVVPVTTKNLSGNDIETARYAFYIDEGGSRQNLALQGPNPSASPSPVARIYASDPNELPLVTATAAPSPFGTTQLKAINSERPAIFTPATTNSVLVDQSAGVTPAIDDYSYATASAIANLTPEGKPRLNLQKLKTYIDSLNSVSQALSNPKSQLVDQLLNPGEAGDNWGGGNLSILTKLPEYSADPKKPKQIVANLIDYLDDDLIPTTDNVDNPTYFGVEGRASSDGTVVGHPYINFVGTGLVFNRSNASGAQGGLNSTRVLVVLGIVNPWSKPTKDWNTFYATPNSVRPVELEVKITGSASGGNLGSQAQNYFHSDFTTADSSNQLSTAPTQAIAPNAGYVFPALASSGNNYANNFDILNTGGGRQPPGMVFSNLGFQITKLRLKYTDTDGRSGYVQVLDNLKAIPQPANPATVDLDHSGSPGSLVYKFASGAPGKEDFHLNNDPRLNLLSASWILSTSTENGTNPPNPGKTINVF
ncbi:MAG: hypothetical protein ACXWG7_00210, partial [Chthoniobacterales bacterium]